MENKRLKLPTGIPTFEEIRTEGYVKSLFLFFMSFFSLFCLKAQVADKTTYLSDIKQELQKTWPENRTINLVFHGHSVPSGYFDTPNVRTLQSKASCPA